MTRIELCGDLGPVEALELRGVLDRETADVRPQVILDLSAVDTMHPAVAAAIVRAARRARQRAGALSVIAPMAAAAARTVGLVSLQDLL